jgi:transposase
MIRGGFLSAEDRQEFERVVRRPTTLHGAARRANALLLLDDGMSCVAVAKVLYLDDDTVRGWYEAFTAKGTAVLEPPDHKGAKRSLSPEQESQLSADLSARPFISTAEIMRHIFAGFSVSFSRPGLIKLLRRLGFEYRKPKPLPAGASVEAQEAFIAAYEQLMGGLSPDEVVYFADAVHPEYQSRPAFGWFKRGDQVAVKCTSGRKRLNLHGALCLENFDCQIVEGETISAETTLRLFKKLQARHPLKRAIHVFIDNARYHHARDVKAWLERTGCRIVAHFLPAYAPNLNAIERLWAVMHSHVTHNKHYPSEAEFIAAVFGFFKDTLPNQWQSFRDTITDNFHIIRPDRFRVLS